MGVALEIKAGSFAGKVIALKTGESVTVGRSSAKAEVALQDTFMSGLHFAVECGTQGCRVVDRKSSNGTFLNGRKIQDAALLTNGDEIRAGQTVFSVKMVADEKMAALGIVPKAAPATRVAAPPAGAEQPSSRPQAAKEEKELGAFPGQIAPPPGEAKKPLQEPPAPAMKNVEPRAEPPVVSPMSGAGEPPRFRAIPTPPAGVPTPPRLPAHRSAEFEQPKAVPPASQRPRDVEQPRVPPQPPPPAPEDFGERALRRSGGVARRAAFRVMGWSFPAAPAEWQVQEGFGLQQRGENEFPGSMAATEEPLGGITLQQFVESQISTLRGYLRNAKVEPSMPPRVAGADESMAVEVRHSTKDGRELIYRYVYARAGSSVGILTVTTLAGEFARVLESLEPLLDGAEFQSTVNA